MIIISLKLTRSISVSLLITLLVCLPASGQLKISLSTDKQSYGYGESIVLTGTVTNNADTAVTVMLPYQGPVGVPRCDNVQMTWILLPTYIPYVYAPHSSLRSAFKLDMARLGLPNKPGPHTLQCNFFWELGNGSFSGKDSVTFDQPVFYGGQLEVSFSVQIPTAQIQALRDSMHAVVVSSQTILQMTVERWSTSGFILDSLVTKYSGDNRLLSIQADRQISSPTMVVTHVAGMPSDTGVCRLFQNFPNPFNLGCAIEFEIESPQYVTISVSDLVGRLVFKETRFVCTTGRQRMTFDGSSLPSGCYFYRLETRTTLLVRKMLLLK